LNRKRKFIGAVICFLSLFLILTPKTGINKGIAVESECANCHTNLKKLMDLSWEVKKVAPEEALSREISGEG
jgi:hypothetical protein